jgi:DNA-binding transcriptional ArsR family regulator
MMWITFSIFSLAPGKSRAILNLMVKYLSNELDFVFGALADPTRRRILEQLAHGQTRATRLAEPFAISLPAVSKHLRVLEHAGLLKRRRQGREHLLELEASPIKEAWRWMERYRQFWEGSLDALAEYLEKQPITKQKKGRT